VTIQGIRSPLKRGLSFFKAEVIRKRIVTPHKIKSMSLDNLNENFENLGSDPNF